MNMQRYRLLGYESRRQSGYAYLSDPYPADDWGGSTKRRMYVDMVCMNPAEPEAGSNIPLEKLQKAIPAFEWSRGHSGVLLPNNIVDELAKLM